MSTNAECLSEFNAEVKAYEIVTYCSLSLAAVICIVSIFCKARLGSDPESGFIFFFGMGGVKFLLGILLFSANPTCSVGCNCGSYQPTYVFPVLVVVLGFVWIYRGVQVCNLNRDGAPTVEGHDFGIPAMEMKSSHIFASSGCATRQVLLEHC